MSFNYIVRSLNETSEEGRPLFWNNDDGWVDLDNATTFTNTERLMYDPPLVDEAEWQIDHRGHEITYNLRGVYAQELLAVNENGDIFISPDGELETITDTFLYCETCSVDVMGVEIGANDSYEVL